MHGFIWLWLRSDLFFFFLLYMVSEFDSPNPAWHLDFQGSLFVLNRVWGSWNRTGGGTLLECSFCRLAEEFLFSKICPEFVQHCCYGNKLWIFEHRIEEKCTLRIDHLFWNGSLESGVLFSSNTFQNMITKLPEQGNVHVLTSTWGESKSTSALSLQLGTWCLVSCLL